MALARISVFSPRPEPRLSDLNHHQDVKRHWCRLVEDVGDAHIDIQSTQRDAEETESFIGIKWLLRKQQEASHQAAAEHGVESVGR